MDMDKQHSHGHAACTGTCSPDTDVQDGWSYSMDMAMDMLHGQGYASWTWICSMDMDMQDSHRHAAWTSIDMNHGHGTCSNGHGHGHAARICTVLAVELFFVFSVL
jgi:hypothetical protein